MTTAILRELAVDRSELEDRAYLALRQKIIDRELAPGTVLTIGQVAGALNVSPTPARDALRHLIADGLLISLSSLRRQFIFRMALLLPTAFPDAVVGFNGQALSSADPSNQGAFNGIVGEIGLSEREHNWLGDTKSRGARLVAMRWACFSGCADIGSATVRGCGHV